MTLYSWYIDYYVSDIRVFWGSAAKVVPGNFGQTFPFSYHLYPPLRLSNLPLNDDNADVLAYSDRDSAISNKGAMAP